MNRTAAWIELPECSVAIADRPVRCADYVHFAQATGRAVPQGVISDYVVNIGWEDAAAFCQWLSARSGVYRLPTLSEMIRLIALASKDSPIEPCAQTPHWAGEGGSRCLAEWVSDTIAHGAHMRVTFFPPWNRNEPDAEPAILHVGDDEDYGVTLRPIRVTREQKT